MSWGSGGAGAVHRVAIRAIGNDPRAAGLLDDAHALGVSGVAHIGVVDLIHMRGELDDPDRERLTELFCDALLQEATWGPSVPASSGTIVVETTLLAGVTDSVAAEVLRAADIIGVKLDAASTGRRFELYGTLTDADVERLTRRLLANPVIERWSLGDVVPTFTETGPRDIPVEVIALRGLDDDGLAALNQQRGLALDPAELCCVRDHFAALGRDPTDVELETIAQTWSEHCAHKTFRAGITFEDAEEVPCLPLLTQLRSATSSLGAPWVKSAFVGNAGVVQLGSVLYAIKVETHNHPSAVEPFGGANTGVGGVIRDVLGVFARPIAVTDVLCFGPADLNPAELPDGVLHPRLIRSGVVAGIADYGNKLGLPTVAGAVLYDAGFTANPLVFAGCLGVVPEDRLEPPGPQPGDRVVVIGGRTGRDGLRGATFSSMTMDATTGDLAGASVQIGDPIVEKLVMEVVTEAAALANSITDCGAGGLSSAVGEMADGVGADVDLALVPLKYPGLASWEIWLSEAQERMVLAVPSLGPVAEICARHGVEWADIGVFTGTGRLVVRHGERVVADLDTRFVHDGRPQRQMIATAPKPDRGERTRQLPAAPGSTLLALLGHPTIASKEAVIRRYDHEIRGATVVRPLVGVDCDAPADGVVLAEPAAFDGVALGIGVNPWHGELDPERMAETAVDEAVRNVVVAGADPDRIALLDNFSWGDPRRAETLGQLVAAVRGCVRGSLAFAAPFVSGKDSLNNEYLGRDGERHAVPPTLVVTSLAHVPDVEAVVTPDLKHVDDALVLLGGVRPEFGGSHFDLVTGGPPDGAPGATPALDEGAPERYRRFHRSIRAGHVRAAHDVSEGGLAVALAEMAIGGRLGLDVAVPGADGCTALFSESSGRIVAEVAPCDLEDFLGCHGDDATVIGAVNGSATVRIAHGGSTLIDIELDALRRVFAGGAT